MSGVLGFWGYLLWDNAPYHSSDETRAALQALGFKLIFSAPYSYSAAPVEMLFSCVKFGEINPERLPTGKKSLENVGLLVR